MIYNENCIDTMKKMDDCSIPFIITDPPYLLNFMGKEFDSQHHEYEGKNEGQKMQKWHEEWCGEAFRVLKPGGYLVAFGGSRTAHRLASAMEDVGFEIRDTIMWVYGSGFPKSLNISKAIDKVSGIEPIGSKPASLGMANNPQWNSLKNQIIMPDATTPEAKQWEGYGTALKPAHEPIIIGMKALDKNFVNNALTHGVAGINIDASRIKHDEIAKTTKRIPRKDTEIFNDENCGFDNTKNDIASASALGRFPSNFIMQHHPECKLVGNKKIKNTSTGNGNAKTGEIGKITPLRRGTFINRTDEDGMEIVENWNCHPDCPVSIMDNQSGTLKSGDLLPHHNMSGKGLQGTTTFKMRSRQGEVVPSYGDEGGASRFFYCAKASVSEKNLGLDGMKKEFHRRDDGQKYGMNTNTHRPDGSERKEVTPRENFHPTIKPISLMVYLLKMFSTPDGGLVYDPFAGSGTTLIAAKILGRKYLGSEMDKSYYEIADSRLKYDWETWWLLDKSDDFTKIKSEVKHKFW